MTNEQLCEYKKKIVNLSEKEIKLRDMYLRKLSTGEIMGLPTGYPSIDKPQLSFYDEKEYFLDRPKETVTEALINNNKDNLDTVALDYFGNKIKYRDLFIRYFELSRALVNYGVKKGDYVSICLAGIPEAMTSIYSLGHLGAVGIYLAPYLDIDTMISDIKRNNSKILFIMDLFYKQGKEKFDKVIKEANIEHVIIVPTLNSSKISFLSKKKKYENPIFETYNEFIDKGKDITLPEMVKYEKDMPLAVVYSSGTTGVLKGVLLSHDSFNNSAFSYKSFGFNLSKGQIVYQAIPVWSSTGLIADGATALYYGCTLYENPKFDPIVYSTNLGKQKINWGVATTELFNGLIDLEKKKSFEIKKKLGLYDYSKLENIYIGGTFASPKDKKRLTETLERLGCNYRVNSSYGTCENGSIVTAELNTHSYPDYSVGTPIPGAVVMSIDENNKELKYGQRGELAVKTNCGMIDYYNRPDLHGIFFKEEGSGEVFKHTGDIGYVLPNGIVIYEGRKNDVSIINEEKIYNFDIKRIILNDKDVFDCEVFSKNDNELYANIVFYDKENINVNEKLKEIQSEIYDTYKNENYIPCNFKIRDSFPMASSTKRDYKKIKEETDGYIKIKYKKSNKIKIL